MSSDSPNAVPGPPEGWREKPLISVAEPRFSSVDKLTHGSEEPVRLCNYTDVYNHEYITGDLEFMRASATRTEIDRFRLKIGDVIITKDSETPDDIGISAVVDYAAPDLVCGYHLALLRPDHEQVDPTFLAKQLKHCRLAGYFGRQSNGLTRYGLPIAAVNNTPLWLPELAEQQAVGTILRLVDELIAKTEAVIGKLRQVRAGLADELLTKANHGADRASLSSVAFVRFSSVDKLTLPSEAPVRLCNYLDVYQNNYVTAEMKFMHATATPAEIALFRLQVGDVLITKDSESPDDIGIPCVIESTAPDLLCGYHLALIRPNQTRIDPTYLALQLAHHRLAAYFGQQAVGSTRYGLSMAAIAKAPILLPRIEEQREAGKLIRLQDAQISQHETELRKLKSIKSGLMDDLLTGRVRVPESLEGSSKTM